MIEFILFVLCVYGEARGEGQQGMLAVANVVKNRVEQRGTYVHQEILRDRQFSYFNNDWEMAKRDLEKFDCKKDAESLKTAFKVSLMVMFNTKGDNTKGATFYHAKRVKPYWVDYVDLTVEIKNHVFYKKRVKL